MNRPVLVTVAAILCWALLSVVSRILLLDLALDPWMFSFIQLSAGGVGLLAIGGCKGVDLSSFKYPTTWALGALRVLSAALYTAVLAWISVLEAGILGAMSMPVIALCVWALTRRRPARFEWLGHLIILAAVCALALRLEDTLRTAAVGLMALNALCLTAMNLLAERHPDNISDVPGVRTRFTGAVLLVTAGLFAFGRLLQHGALEGGIDMPLVVAGVCVGVFLRAPAMLLAFWSIRLVGAQGYTAAISLLPVFGMGFEQAFVALGLLSQSRLQIGTVGLAGGVVAGTLVVLAARKQAARAPVRGSAPMPPTGRTAP